MPANQPFFLYIEDDPASREIMQTLLTDVMGFTQVALFEDSANIIERLKALPEIPHVIFLDIHVQPINGHHLFEMIHKIPEFNRSILVALTASVMSNEVEHLRQTGFQQLISKPIDPLTFPDRVTAILAGKEVWDMGWG